MTRIRGKSSFIGFKATSGNGKTKYTLIVGIIIISAFALFLALIPTSVTAAVWKKIDEHGIIHYTTDPKGNGWEQVIANKNKRSLYDYLFKNNERLAISAAQTATKMQRRSIGNFRKYRPIINKLSLAHKIDPDLVHAVVLTESDYNPKAVSNKGAMGLMQLMPQTAADYGVKDPYNPQQNLKGGIEHLKDLLRRYKKIELALAAYNAGAGAVDKYNQNIPPYKETQQYVIKVLSELYLERKRQKQVIYYFTPKNTPENAPPS